MKIQNTRVCEALWMYMFYFCFTWWKFKNRYFRIYCTRYLFLNLYGQAFTLFTFITVPAIFHKNSWSWYITWAEKDGNRSERGTYVQCLFLLYRNWIFTSDFSSYFSIPSSIPPRNTKPYPLPVITAEKTFAERVTRKGYICNIVRFCCIEFLHRIFPLISPFPHENRNHTRYPLPVMNGRKKNLRIIIMYHLKEVNKIKEQKLIPIFKLLAQLRFVFFYKKWFD